MYLRSLPQMQTDDFPIGELLRGVQMDNTSLAEGGDGIAKRRDSVAPLLIHSPITSSAVVDEDSLLASTEHTNYQSVISMP